MPKIVTSARRAGVAKGRDRNSESDKCKLTRSTSHLNCLLPTSLTCMQYIRVILSNESKNSLYILIITHPREFKSHFHLNHLPQITQYTIKLTARKQKQLSSTSLQHPIRMTLSDIGSHFIAIVIFVSSLLHVHIFSARGVLQHEEFYWLLLYWFWKILVLPNILGPFVPMLGVRRQIFNESMITNCWWGYS